MAEDYHDVAARFELFGRPGYSFAPVRRGPVAWLIANPWALALFSIVIVGLGALQYRLLGTDLLFTIETGGRTSTIDFFVDDLLAEIPIYILPVMAAIVVELALFNGFIHKAPTLLLDLARAGRLAPKEPSGQRFSSIAPKKWDSYARDLDRALTSPWRYATIVLFALIFAVLIARLSQGRQTWDPIFHSNNPDGAIHFVIWEASILLVYPILILPLISLAFWTMFVVGLYIRRLPQIFALDIRINHGDGCGGLMRIGDVCTRMAVIAVLPGVVIGFWGLSNILSDSISQLTEMVVVAAAIMVAAAFLSFLWPVWEIHQAMARAKATYLDEAADSLGPVEEKLRMALAAGQADEVQIQGLEMQLAKLRLVYPDKLNFLTWPFNSGVLYAFYTSQILPVLTVVQGLAKFARDLNGD